MSSDAGENRASEVGGARYAGLHLNNIEMAKESLAQPKYAIKKIFMVETLSKDCSPSSMVSIV